jgi:hypothetical protein
LSSPHRRKFDMVLVGTRSVHVQCYVPRRQALTKRKPLMVEGRPRRTA